MLDPVPSFLWCFTLNAASWLAALTLSTAVFFWLHGRYAAWKFYRKIPVIPSSPIVSYWKWTTKIYRQKSPRSFMLRIIYSIYDGFKKEKILMFWIGFRPLILFLKPEAVEILLNNSRTITKSAEYRFLQPWLGNGLITGTGSKWRSHRKLLTPAFHYAILENFLATFNEEAAILTKKLELETGKPWIDIVPMITMLTLASICQTAMGVQLNIQSGCWKDYVDRIEQIGDVFFYRALRPWLWPDFIFNYCSPSGWKFRRNVKALQEFTLKVIKDKKESVLREKAGDMCEDIVLDRLKKKKAFLELLLEAHLKDESFAEENIREEVDTFMFAGHDTTAMSISWTLNLLGQHQDIQEKVYQELDGIFAGHREREVTSEDLKQMKYLECVIKESLRLYPSVPFIARQLTENLEFDNYNLAPGGTCFVCIYMLHRDPDQFPEPETFDPDRFSPENSIKRHPYAYIPFSAGPRNCIGQRFAMMEIKTALAHILRKFKITSLDDRNSMLPQAGLILKNGNPIRIHLDKR